MSKSVWVLMGVWSFEGGCPIKVFQSEEKAKNLCKFILGSRPSVSEDEVEIMKLVENSYYDDFKVEKVSIDDEE